MSLGKCADILSEIDSAQRRFCDREYFHLFRDLKQAVIESHRNGKLDKEHSHFTERLEEIRAVAKEHQKIHEKMLCPKDLHDFEERYGETACIHCGEVRNYRHEQMEAERSHFLNRLYEFQRSFPTILNPSEEWLVNLSRYASLREIKRVLIKIQSEIPKIVRQYSNNPQVIIEPKAYFDPEGKVNFNLYPVMLEIARPGMLQLRDTELRKLEEFLPVLYK